MNSHIVVIEFVGKKLVPSRKSQLHRVYGSLGFANGLLLKEVLPLRCGKS